MRRYAKIFVASLCHFTVSTAGSRIDRKRKSKERARGINKIKNHYFVYLKQDKKSINNCYYFFNFDLRTFKLRVHLKVIARSVFEILRIRESLLFEKYTMVVTTTNRSLFLALCAVPIGGLPASAFHTLSLPRPRLVTKAGTTTLPLWFAPSDDGVDEESATSTTASDSKRTVDPYIEMQYESYFDGTKPDSSWKLALGNFKRQGASIIEQGLEALGLKKVDPLKPPACLNIKLSNEAVYRAEEKRVANGGGVDAHPVSRALYDLGCLFLDELFDERPIQRFWFLETIARIPYFSYVSMLHLYESFGYVRTNTKKCGRVANLWSFSISDTHLLSPFATFIPSFQMVPCGRVTQSPCGGR